MYKKASRQTGGSRSNGYARVASNADIERGCADSKLARMLVRLRYDRKEEISSLSDYDLALLATRLVLERYTANSWLTSIAGPIGVRLDALEDKIALSADERRAIVTVIPEIVERWRINIGWSE